MGRVIWPRQAVPLHADRRGSPGWELCSQVSAQGDLRYAGQIFSAGCHPWAGARRGSLGAGCVAMHIIGCNDVDFYLLSLRGKLLAQDDVQVAAKAAQMCFLNLCCMNIGPPFPAILGRFKLPPGISCTDQGQGCMLQVRPCKCRIC
jgi:hypothetical protein